MAQNFTALGCMKEHGIICRRARDRVLGPSSFVGDQLQCSTDNLMLQRLSHSRLPPSLMVKEFSGVSELNKAEWHAGLVSSAAVEAMPMKGHRAEFRHRKLDRTRLLRGSFDPLTDPSVFALSETRVRPR